MRKTMKSYLNRLRRRGAIAATLVFSLIFVCGCGGKSSKNTTLSGKVTYKDLPLTGGTITVSSAEGKEKINATISPEGTYTVSGLVPGEMIVMIETESIRGQTGVSYQAPPGHPAPDMGVKLAKYVPIPKSYGDPRSSPLRVTLKNGSNKKDFNLNESGQ
jgi:hypothetical protein